jgi:flagellar biosynthesis chaperone FliJ
MNKARRTRIEKLRDELLTLKDELEEIIDEEQEYLDNMPESMANGAKGETAQGNLDVLRDAFSGIEEAESYLGEIN